jgi:PhnB protein
MKKLNPYLNFQPGKAREALNFYKDCLKGEIVSIQTMEDAKMDVPEPFKKNVIHAEFKAEGIQFFVSDGRPDQPPKPGTNNYMCIDFTDGKEQEDVYKALGNGGKIDMELQDTFWGARFAVLYDRYGIGWMLNWTKPKA